MFSLLIHQHIDINVRVEVECCLITIFSNDLFIACTYKLLSSMLKLRTSQFNLKKWNVFKAWEIFVLILIFLGCQSTRLNCLISEIKMLNSSAPRLAASNTAEIYPTHINLVNQSPRRTVLCHSSEKQSKNSTEKDGDIGFGLKSVWVGAELLGNVIGAVKKKKEIENDEPSTSGRPALTREEVLELLRQDYDQNYFISGVGDLRWADPNCRYADPFAGEF